MCSNALLILLSCFLYLELKWARVMYPGTCCDKVGMAEHLNRVPTHPIKMEGVVYNGPHLYLWYKRIPKVPRELSWLPSLLYIVFFSYVVQKVILYRSNHFVSYVCQVVFVGQFGAEWVLRVARVLDYWPAAAPGTETQCVWWCLVDPAYSLYSKLKWFLGSVTRNALWQSCRLAKALDRGPLSSVKVERI